MSDIITRVKTIVTRATLTDPEFVQMQAMIERANQQADEVDKLLRQIGAPFPASGSRDRKRPPAGSDRPR